MFYHLLRPEFVKSLPTALSSDVFLGWVRGDPDAKRLEEDVKAATRFLHGQVIPAFARRMDERADEVIRLGPAKFTQFLHAAGINCRHLGEVRAHCQHAGVRRLLATEVVSRVVKNDIALRLRSKVRALWCLVCLLCMCLLCPVCLLWSVCCVSLYAVCLLCMCVCCGPVCPLCGA